MVKRTLIEMRLKGGLIEGIDSNHLVEKWSGEQSLLLLLYLAGENAS